MTQTEVKELIGLDVGVKRTGMARASSAARLAEPMGSVPTEELPALLSKLLKEGSVEAVVVGLPRNLQGDDTPQTRWVRDWVRNIKNRTKATFYWQDEALTSHAAELSAQNTKKKTQDIDALAATIILQDFLDTPASERVVC